jgi:hypothetical protein
MDIQETRRANLRKWLATRTMPKNEKSYFSQLVGGSASFGERAARRLESKYGMGEGYLDSTDLSNPPIRGDYLPLSDEALDLIKWIERIDSLGDPARKIFLALTSILQVAESVGAKHNSNSVQALIAETDEMQGVVPQPESAGGTNNAARKPRSRK